MAKDLHEILLVDDSSFIHKLVKEQLLDTYSCSSAMDAIHALEMLKNNRYDLVLTDVNMPGMSGIEFCKVLKAGEYKDIPLILMSSESNSNTVINGVAAGANDYLIKPFNKEELLVRLDTQFSIIDTRRERDSLAKLETAKALIVTMSHEVNNPLLIAMTKISNIIENKKKKFSLCENTKSELVKVENTLERIKEVMVKIRKIEAVETSNYTDNISMLDLDKSTNE